MNTISTTIATKGKLIKNSSKSQISLTNFENKVSETPADCK